MPLENLRSCNRKKYKRAMNKIIREFNDRMKLDWLWNGRFVVSQKEAYFYPYSDHSGGNYIVSIIITDTKTNNKQETFVDNYNAYYILWHWANKCIVENFKVWEEKPNPNEQARLEGREPPSLYF